MIHMAARALRLILRLGPKTGPKTDPRLGPKTGPKTGPKIVRHGSTRHVRHGSTRHVRHASLITVTRHDQVIDTMTEIDPLYLRFSPIQRRPFSGIS